MTHNLLLDPGNEVRDPGIDAGESSLSAFLAEGDHSDLVEVGLVGLRVPLEECSWLVFIGGGHNVSLYMQEV